MASLEDLNEVPIYYFEVVGYALYTIKCCSRPVPIYSTNHNENYNPVLPSTERLEIIFRQWHYSTAFHLSKLHTVQTKT